MADTKVLMTAEQLLELPRERRVELVRGELVDMAPVSIDHGDTVGLLQELIGPYVRSRKLGRVGPEIGFVLARNPDIVRAPDIAFVRAERLTQRKPKGFYEGPPDLAVEVLSPDDTASEVQQKVQDYLLHGTRLVWVVDPHSKTVTAYQPSGEAHVYSGDEAVPGGEVLPGFSLRPADLFNV
jgi:Uma2 family endonuclease